MRYLLPAAAALFFSTPVFAQTVDDHGATQLEQDLSRYLGQEVFSEGVISVSPEDDAYKITVDFGALSGLWPEQQVLEVDFAPYALFVRPRDDGKWDVSFNDAVSGSWAISMPEGRQSSELTTTGVEGSGVYDPSLAAFTSASSSYTGMTMSTRAPGQEVQASTGPATSEMTGRESANGGVDVTFVQEIADFAETINFTDRESGQSFSVKMSAPKATMDGDVTGLRSWPLLDLLAFAIANSDEAEVVEKQAELKSLLLAALPVWERLEGAYWFQNPVVETPVGNFAAGAVDFELGTDGISQNGAIEYSLTATDLKVPAYLLPAWSRPILPTQVNLNIGGADLNLDGPARKAINALDLSKEPPIPQEVSDEIAADFEANPPSMVISRSTVSNDEMEIAFEGEVSLVGEVPKSNMTIEVAGFDKIEDALKGASEMDPKASQYVAMALAMKGFGKTLPDGRIRWAIDLGSDGSVAVNGVMVKPADRPSAGNAQ